jgi:hypothetical protein
MTLSRRKYGTYAYQCTWSHGKPINVYIGSGAAALAAVALDAEAREERARERQAEAERERAERERFAAVERELDVLTAEARALAHAALEAAGYYQHRRGEWRKRGRRTQAHPGPA